jgi:predicted RecB family nuclease
MQLRDGRLVLSPSDLSGFVACPHLSRLELAVTRGELKRPIFQDLHAELIRRKGDEHEAAYLARLRADGRRVLCIPRHEAGLSHADARRLSEEAIRAREADVLYQPYLADDSWHGYADFLERVADGSYEPVDTKLARTARPEHLLQLCFYSEQLARIQGRLPERFHVELGSGLRQSFRTSEFMAYYRRVRGRFLAAMENGGSTYPWRCEHCPICAWRRECHKRLVADDHLVLVAGLGRSQAESLQGAGIATLADLGQSAHGTAVRDLRPETFETLRHQAELQFEHRRTGEHRIELLPDEEGRGFHLLPEPCPGDVWLDLEGHPFYEAARGLEYLFGFCYRDDDGEPRYRALWAADRGEERKAFEDLLDWIAARRRRFPAMHVYHFANYERVALRRLMGEHGTREDEMDDLLRQGVLVDLHRVARQALRASVESYSIKKLEALYGFQRTASVLGGNESTVLFEAWLECGERSLLDEVERYNEDDCRSTLALHQWLLSQRPADLPWRAPPDTREIKPEAEVVAEERERVKAALLLRSQAEGDSWWLLSHLLDYHRREAKPQWWEWFHHLELDEGELIEDSDTIGGLEPVGEPAPDKKSLIYTLSFPPQDHKIGGRCVDPATQKTYDVHVDDERGMVMLRRGVSRKDEPLPRGLIPDQPLQDTEQRGALMRFAGSYLSGEDAYPALVALLERRRPRADLGVPVPEAVLTLDRSYLFVQGPPGAGKTWQGAKAAVALMRAGQRIGVTSLSHRGINKLLAEIEREAAEQDFRFRGRKKHTEEEDAHRGPFIDSTAEWKDLLDPELQLLAGTSWLFARAAFDRSVDTLFIDEAGQVALADAFASGTSAHSLVLLGDPNQLPQVSQGAQPEAAKASALQHLLGEHEIVPPEMGIFLPETWRLRPEVCAFTSEAYYKGRLVPAEVCAKRSLAAGNGLVVIQVAHEGRSQASWEEADAIAAEIQRLLGTPFTDARGACRPLTVDDMLVVAPYNAQVRALRARVPAGVRVGTVDKFQGQEAPVVLVSLVSSSGADAPRGIQFAFDRHRVNVATSRGQCRVVLVCSPRLLEAECRTVLQMSLMNAVCRFAELAENGSSAVPAARDGNGLIETSDSCVP